jgi:ParB-like chromosome segregation protein Spo0J
MSDDVTDFEGTPEPELRLEFHPLSNTFPMMPEDELAEMIADIRKNGLQQPIVLFEGQILDGRNRYLAGLKAGVALRTAEYEGSDPMAFVVSANLHRRHLTQAQKKEVIEKLLTDQPTRSDTAIGKLAHADHKTVGVRRAELEERGEIPRVERRADTKGRSYPAPKKREAGSSSSVPPVTASAATQAREASAVLAFARLLHEGDINRHLEHLLRLLGDEKKRIAAVPQSQREALARGFLRLLDMSPDELQPIVSVPIFEGARLAGEARSPFDGGRASGEPPQ